MRNLDRIDVMVVIGPLEVDYVSKEINLEGNGHDLSIAFIEISNTLG